MRIGATTLLAGLCFACNEKETNPEPTQSEPEDVYPDADGDGFTTESDCDDSDPEVYPGAPETCNERDDNCNQEVDEGAIDATQWFKTMVFGL